MNFPGTTSEGETNVDASNAAQAVRAKQEIKSRRAQTSIERFNFVIEKGVGKVVPPLACTASHIVLYEEGIIRCCGGKCC